MTVNGKPASHYESWEIEWSQNKVDNVEQIYVFRLLIINIICNVVDVDDDDDDDRSMFLGNIMLI